MIENKIKGFTVNSANSSVLNKMSFLSSEMYLINMSSPPVVKPFISFYRCYVILCYITFITLFKFITHLKEIVK